MRITRYDVGISLLITAVLGLVVWALATTIQHGALALSRIKGEDIELAIQFTEHHYRFFGLLILAFIANYTGHIANRLRDLVETHRELRRTLEQGATRQG